MTSIAPTSAGKRAGNLPHVEADYPVFEIPSALRRSVATALQQGETHYTVVAGVEPVRTEVMAALVTRGIAADTADLLLTAGEQESRFLAIQALRRSGATIAIPAVVHPGAQQAATLLSNPPIRMEVDPQRLTVTAAGVRSAIDAGATALYIENPARLTGACIPQAELAEIRTLCTDAKVWIVWDAGLSEWTAAASATTLGTGDQTLTLGMPWPTLGLEPWSPGFLVGPPEMLSHCRSIKQVISICTNTLTQWSGAGGTAVYAAEHRDRLGAQQQRYGEAISAATQAGLTPLPGEAVATLALQVTAEQQSRIDACAIPYSDGALFGAAGVIRLVIAGDESTARALLAYADQEVSS